MQPYRSGVECFEAFTNGLLAKTVLLFYVLRNFFSGIRRQNPRKQSARCPGVSARTRSLSPHAWEPFFLRAVALGLGVITDAEAIAVIDVATGDASTPGWVPCFIVATFPGRMPPPSGPDLGASLAFDRFPFNPISTLASPAFRCERYICCC